MPDTVDLAEPQLNATPLIDVLLVLLIMLIFTIPVATHAVKLNLPQWDPLRAHQQEFISLDVDFDGTVIWNGAPVESIESLEQRLRGLKRYVPAPAVIVHADRRGRYERVAQVLAAAGRARVQRLTIAQEAYP